MARRGWGVSYRILDKPKGAGNITGAQIKGGETDKMHNENPYWGGGIELS